MRRVGSLYISEAGGRRDLCGVGLRALWEFDSHQKFAPLNGAIEARVRKH